MKPTQPSLGTLFGLTSFLAPVASAQLSLEPVWGSQSSASVADRRFTSSSSNFNFAPSDGGAGTLSSENFLSESRGTSSSYSVLDASSGISVPLIQTYASTNDGNWAAFGSSVVVEGYTYTGANTANFNLDASLTGSVSNLDTNFSGNFATLSIWTPGFGLEPPILGRTSNLGDGFFFSTDEGSYYEFGFNQLDTIRLSQNITSGSAPSTGTLSWTMDPGDTVYLWASGRSSVYGANSTADARNTLTTSFQDATGLTSFSGGVVPEPSTLLLSLLATLGILRRRR